MDRKQERNLLSFTSVFLSFQISFFFVFIPTFGNNKRNKHIFHKTTTTNIQKERKKKFSFFLSARKLSDSVTFKHLALDIVEKRNDELLAELEARKKNEKTAKAAMKELEKQVQDVVQWKKDKHKQSKATIAELEKEVYRVQQEKRKLVAEAVTALLIWRDLWCPFFFVRSEKDEENQKS